MDFLQNTTPDLVNSSSWTTPKLTSSHECEIAKETIKQNLKRTLKKVVLVYSAGWSQ